MVYYSLFYTVLTLKSVSVNIKKIIVYSRKEILSKNRLYLS